MREKLFSASNILENGRAKLVPLQEMHFELLWPLAAGKDIWRYTQAAINNKNDFRNYFDAALRERELQLSYPFAVFDKHTECWAGSTRFGSFSFEHKRLEIGWTWYGSEFHGSGLNAACKNLLLNFAFRQLGVNRVELKTSLLNTRSQRAMEKLGAVKEGIFRHHMVNADGSLRDSVYYSFVREEWQEVEAKYFPGTY